MESASKKYDENLFPFMHGLDTILAQNWTNTRMEYCTGYHFLDDEYFTNASFYVLLLAVVTNIPYSLYKPFFTGCTVLTSAPVI